MAQLTVTIDIGNAATVTDDGHPDPAALAALLHKAADDVANGYTYRGIKDANGTTVGSVAIG